MFSLEDLPVYRKYAKQTPKIIRVLLKFFWCIFYIPYRKIQLIKNLVLCQKMSVNWQRADFIYTEGTGDYVRHSSLELISKEIYENNIQGNTAELGVFQGRFAQYINQVFPDRKLYLFDTFEGFNKSDIDVEKRKNFYVPYEGTFKNTTVDIVLNKMRHRENCIIKKGYFPETAKDLEDTFVFVNIDVDMSEPIYNGLRWFYPRLAKGGYIFVHDFNSSGWGAKAGVMRFVKESGVPYFPLSDTGGGGRAYEIGQKTLKFHIKNKRSA